MHERIVILSPTKQEVSDILKSEYNDHDGCNVCAVEICGVGMAEVAATTYEVINKYDPTLIILVGVAGHYPESKYIVGDVVLIESERIADLGAIHPAGFLPMYTKEYECPYADRFKTFNKATSNTVSTGAAPFVEPGGTDLENMEGASFFSMCIKAGVPFLEMRAVSNPVSADRKRWDLPLAIENISTELNKLLHCISSYYK